MTDMEIVSFGHCGNTLKCMHTALEGTAHYCAVRAVLSQGWQCSRFVHTSLTTHIWRNMHARCIINGVSKSLNFITICLGTE